MKRFVTLVATMALAAGLVTGGPAAAATPGCPDPSEAVVGGTVFGDYDVVLGPRETAELTFEMGARTACLDVYPASIQVATPARVIPAVPTTITKDRETGFTTLRGTLKVDASQLTNADAGEWVFEFKAGDVSSRFWPLNLQRRTTLSFDASPEPLRRNHKLTFRGTLRAADWGHSGYRGVRGQEVVIFAIDGQTTPTWEPLVVLQTKRHGHYRTRVQVAGPNRFEAVFRGTFGLHQVTSRIDTVAAPA
jgi:hypothetical protein